MGELIPESKGEQWIQTVTRLGIALIAAFIFPIFVSVFGSTKLLFVNIELIGKADFFTTLGLLYPLIAGIIVIWAARNVETISRPIILVSVGIFPFLMSFLNKNDFMASSIREYNAGVTIMLFLLLSLIGVFIGSKIVSMTDHPSGGLIGGISGILFLVLVLLPVTGGTPIYFALFGLFKNGSQLKLPGSLILLGIALIAIFTCYILASVIAALNFSYRPSSEKTAKNAVKLVIYATLALPISILVAMMFSGAGGSVFWSMLTLIIKLTLWLGGIIGILVMGTLDLIDQFLPKTVKGGELLKNAQDAFHENSSSS